MTFIISLPYTTVIDLIEKAVEEDRRDKVYQQWLAELPRMEKFMPFNDYYEYVTSPVSKKSKRSDEEILEDAAGILKSMSQ